MPRCFSGLVRPLVAKSSLAVEVIGFGKAKELSDILISPGLTSASANIQISFSCNLGLNSWDS